MPQQDVSKQFTIHIDPAAVPPLQIVTDTFPNGQVGVPFKAQLQISGGVSPDTVSLKSGALPDGLELLEDGTIDGTPTAAGDFQFELEVKDSSQ